MSKCHRLVGYSTPPQYIGHVVSPESGSRDLKIILLGDSIQIKIYRHLLLAIITLNLSYF